MKDKQQRPPCHALWETILIAANGDVTTCCLDLDLVNKLGNVETDDVHELWTGEKINEWRQAQLKGNFKNSGPKCASCPFQNAARLSKEKINKYYKSKNLF
nr:SPASM domain-containing protein [Nanoarchaeota archaeon]